MASPTSQTSTVDLVTLALRLLRRWPILVVAAVVFAAAGTGFSVMQPTTWAAQVDVLVTDPSDEAVFANDSRRQANLDLETQIELAMSPLVATAADTDRRYDTVDLTVSQVGTTSILRFRTLGRDAELAANAANAYAAAYVELRTEQFVGGIRRATETINAEIGELDSKIDALEDRARSSESAAAELERVRAQRSEFADRATQLEVDASLREAGARIVAPADVPASPAGPRPARAGALAAIFGLCVGTAAAWLRDRFDTQLGDVAALGEIVAPVPVVGEIPLHNLDVNVFDGVNKSSVAAEAYRLLASSVAFLSADDDKTIVLTSSGPGDGKTTTAVNLAYALADRGARVALVDADMRRGRLGNAIGFSAKIPGLYEVLTGQFTLAAVIQTRGAVDIVPGGARTDRAGELLGSHGWKSLLACLERDYTHVVIDAPPVLAAADAIIVGAGHKVLFVADARNRADVVDTAVTHLARGNALPAGAVMNRSATAVGAHYGYYDDYRD